MKPLALLAFAVVGLGSLILHASHDTLGATQLSTTIATVSHKLTISGTGTGAGVVTSGPPGIKCTITAGTPAATGCTKLYNQGTVVTLTAKASIGHAFGGWAPVLTACPNSTGACEIKMGSDHVVWALFRKGPFTVKISSGNTGGSGRVKSQAGLTPALDCVITKGKAATTGCSATYPAYDTVTFTATAATGYLLARWGEPTCGTGACQIVPIQNRTIPVSFVPPQPSNPAVEGRWEPVFTNPVVAVHIHLLPTGMVLLWGDKGGDGNAKLWDRAVGGAAGFTTMPKKPFRLYCSGHTLLADGRLLVAGGTGKGTGGLDSATIFDPASKSWIATASMAQGRYYPTITTLPDGEVLAISGHDSALADVTVPEVWNGSGWRRLTTAPLKIPRPYYPDMFVAPNGKVFLAGFPDTTRYLDVTGTGQWTTVGNRKVADRTLGSAVMYAPGKILYVGGGDPPTASAEVIDLNQPNPSWQLLPSGMQFARRQTNATLLADGTVLVTGGTSGPGFNDQANAIHAAEIWNPTTESWKTMASETKNRTYHSTAVLLPSGRVLSSGGGEGDKIPLASSEFSAQLFTPPYLYNPDGSTAARPRITSAPDNLPYNINSFTVESPDAGSVTRGTLIRLSSVTHAFNQSQLLYPLTFTASGTTLTATAPSDGNLAPPGPYMLFLINGSGTPSVAKILMVGP